MSYQGAEPLPVVAGGTGDQSFTAYAPICAGTTSGGALQTASTGFSSSGHVLTSTGATTLPTFQALPAGGVTLDGDTGSATGTTVNVVAGIASSNSGATVSFSGSAATLTLNVQDSNANVFIGNGCGGSAGPPGSGSANVGLGAGVMPSNSNSASDTVAIGTSCMGSGNAVTGAHNVAIGVQAGYQLTSGAGNVLIGFQAGELLSSGDSFNVGIGYATMSNNHGTYNIALGWEAMTGGGTNSYNIGIGYAALDAIGTGSTNIAIGYVAGSNYNGAESNNILLGHSGVHSESNTIHIGTQGSGSGQQNKCFVAGITGATPTSGNTPQVVLCDNAGNLAPISSSTSGYVLTSNGSATPSFQAAAASLIGFTNSLTPFNTALGSGALTSIAGGVDNVAIGYNAVNLSTTGSRITAVGYEALAATTSNHSAGSTAVGYTCLASFDLAAPNTGVGGYVLATVTGGSGHNTAVGYEALRLGTGPSYNTAVGSLAGVSILTGSLNILIGYTAGNSYVGAESNNILIGPEGVAAESNVTRIGYIGGTASTQTTCYIDGIYGVTTSSAGTSTAVLIDNTGNLGTIASSLRHKENVKPIDRSILNLRPVQFNYIKDASKTLEFGLIAEEVEKVFPELVVHKDGQPETVRYHELPALLLNEIQKLVKRVEFLESQLAKK